MAQGRRGMQEDGPGAGAVSQTHQGTGTERLMSRALKNSSNRSSCLVGRPNPAGAGLLPASSSHGALECAAQELRVESCPSSGLKS